MSGAIKRYKNEGDRMKQDDTNPAISGTTVLFACIAHPVAHVRAPTIFNEAFAKAGQDAVMVPMDILPEGLSDWVSAMRAMPNFIGSAVTIPFKMPLAELCDTLGPVAQITGAVNAVRFKNGQLIGDNFDGSGFVAGLLGQGHNLADAKILLIGAGGAARAIAYGLCQEPIDKLDVYNRTITKADELVHAVLAHNPSAALSSVPTLRPEGYDIVINATSLGLSPDDAMPCDINAVSSHALICDIIMVPAQTAWLKAAQERGLSCHYGRHMLDYQIDLIAQFIGAKDI